MASLKRRLMGDLDGSHASAGDTPVPPTDKTTPEGSVAKKPNLLRAASAPETSDTTDDSNQGNGFMRPHQLRSLFVALQQEKRTNRELASKVSSLELERGTMQETLSCVQRHWNQLTKDLEHALCGMDFEFCKTHAESATACTVVPPSVAKVPTPTSGFNSIAGRTGPSVTLAAAPKRPTASASDEDVDEDDLAKYEKTAKEYSDLEAKLAKQVSQSRLLMDKKLNAHLVEAERAARTKCAALADTLALKQDDNARLGELLRVAEDDVRRTHRYIARVLHDNPGLKLSMFGIGAEGYLPPAVSVKLEDNIPVPPATPAVPPPPITKPETLAVTPMIPVTPALVSSAPAPNLSRSESATQSVDREPLGDSSEITALRRDLEDATELANARLAELTGLYDRVTFMQQDLEKLKLQPPDETAVKASAAYLELALQARTEAAKAVEYQRQLAIAEDTIKDLQARVSHLLREVQLSDQSARAEYDNRVQAAQQAAKELASELETVKAELSLAQAQRKEYENVTRLTQHQQDLISSLQEEMKALRGDGYSAIREAKGVVDNINLLEKKAVKLAGIIRDKDSSLESYKLAEKDVKRTERNTAALIAASTAPDAFAAVVERIQTMEKEMSVNDARVNEARSQMAAVREEHEKLSVALFAARGDAEAAKAEKAEFERVIQSLSDSYEASVEKHKRALADLKSARESVSDANVEIARLKHLLEAGNRECESLDRQLKDAGELQSALRRSLEAAEIAVATAQVEVADKRRVTNAAFDRSLEAIASHAKAASEVVASRSQQLEEATRRIDTILAERDAAIKESRRFAEDLAKTSKQLKSRSQEAAMLASRPVRASSTGTPGSVDIFQKAVQCSVCHERLKDRIIAKCYHLFCSECVDENLRSRHRKCPACGQTFGAGDVKPVYLV